MQNATNIKAITQFGYQDGKLTFDSKPLHIDSMGEPLAQFEYADKYLLILPDDPYANSLFFVVLVNKNFKVLELHSAPDDGKGKEIEVEIVSENAIRVGFPSAPWIVEIYSRSKYQPFEAYRRGVQGWLPIFEYPLLIKPGYLGIRRAAPQ